MKEFIEMIKLAAPLGVGFYLGFKGTEAAIRALNSFCEWLAEKIDESIEENVCIEDDEE